MTSAMLEIILLLLFAGLAGVLAGMGVGHVSSSVERRHRTRDNLRRRLVENQQAVAALERTVAAAGATASSNGPEAGTRLAERVAAAKDRSEARASEGAGRT